MLKNDYVLIQTYLINMLSMIAWIRGKILVDRDTYEIVTKNPTTKLTNKGMLGRWKSKGHINNFIKK